MNIDILVEAADSAGVDFVTNYSGRGMYGAECFAIIGREPDLVKFYIELKNIDQDLFEDLVNGGSTDNMGRDYVYYWRSAKTRESSWA